MSGHIIAYCAGRHLDMQTDEIANEMPRNEALDLAFQHGITHGLSLGLFLVLNMMPNDKRDKVEAAYVEGLDAIRDNGYYRNMGIPGDAGKKSKKNH